MSIPTMYTGSDGKTVPINTLQPQRAQNAAKNIRARGGDLDLAQALEEHAVRAIDEYEVRRGNPPPSGNAPKLERADGSETSSKDNNPPDDPFLTNLAEQNEKLLDEIADHELAAARLPATAQSDDDVEKINAWVVKARSLYRKTETTRVDVKEPYLTMGKKIDGFFANLKDNLTNRAKAIEQRNEAYLKAKRAREQAERDAAAAKARQEQAERDAEARRVRDAEIAAQRAAREAEQRIRDAADAEARKIAEEASRKANEEAAAARAATKAADEARALADKAADKADKRADPTRNTQLERTTAGGGAAKLIMEPKYRIADGMEVTLSLGPLGQYLSQTAIQDALARACKANPPPQVPGVVFYEEERVATHATRS